MCNSVSSCKVIQLSRLYSHGSAPLQISGRQARFRCARHERFTIITGLNAACNDSLDVQGHVRICLLSVHVAVVEQDLLTAHDYVLKSKKQAEETQ